MKVLMIGSGGREHALIKALKKSKRVNEIICAPGNGGISKDAKCFNIGVCDVDGIVTIAKEQKIDLCFVAPDDPLAKGIVDRLISEGIRAFGPTAAAARIESSKVFSKNLMKKYNIPTAEYEVFSDHDTALEFIKERNEYPVVVKADGLALGKGVIICNDFVEANQAVSSIMLDKVFGVSGNNIVVEQFIQGPEVSVLSFCDGNTVRPMVSSMDHKRIFDGNKGPNTGGMGTISPNPYYDEHMAERCRIEIYEPTVKAMISEGCPFKGCLYFGLMLTNDGPKVIEYNARFGDPETQVVMPRLLTDFMDIIDAVVDERLDALDIKWDNNATACVVMASAGYPGLYEKGITIKGLDESGDITGSDIIVYHAGTTFDGDFKTSGGRVLGVTASGENLKEALNKAYAAVGKIDFDGAIFRRDIGTAEWKA